MSILGTVPERNNGVRARIRIRYTDASGPMGIHAKLYRLYFHPMRTQFVKMKSVAYEAGVLVYFQKLAAIFIIVGASPRSGLVGQIVKAVVQIAVG